MDQRPPGEQPQSPLGDESGRGGGESPSWSPSSSANASAAPPPRRPRGHSIIAWLVILGVVGNIVWETNRRPASKQQTATERGVGIDKELLGKLVVYVSNSMSKKWSDLVFNQTESLKQGNIREQLGHVVLAAETAGPEEAIKELDDVEGGLAAAATEPAESSATQPSEAAATKPSHDELELIETLRHLYRSRLDPSTPVLTDTDKEDLAEQLGWLGKFAPLTKGTPETAERQRVLNSLRTLPFVLVGIVLWYLICGLTGVICLIVLLVRTLTGNTTHEFVEASGHGGIYAETFAVWMLIWFGLSHAAHKFITADVSISLSIAAAIVAMSAIFWPVIRGVPWATVRRDVGLFLPQRPHKEPAVGLMTYCMALPMLVIGALMVAALSAVQHFIAPGAPPPSHPAQEALIGADWRVIVQIMFLGVIVAPIGEEMMFRGALYRHLRDATGRWDLVVSMLVSALTSSFIFAAIHPQGWVLIPALMGLATGFCLAREWRGSLMAGMIAHGITNFISLTLSVMLFSGS